MTYATSSATYAESRAGVIAHRPSRVASCTSIGAIYGAFTGAILLVGWLWLTNVALLFGAEVDAEIEREKEISEGVHPAATPTLPAKGN